MVCSRRLLLYFLCGVVTVGLPAKVFCWEVRDKVVPSSQVITAMVIVTFAAFKFYDRFFGGDEAYAVSYPEQWTWKEKESDSGSVVAAKSDLRSTVEVLKKQGRDLVKGQKDYEYQIRSALSNFMKNPEGVSEAEKRLLLVYHDKEKIKNFAKNFKTMQERSAGVKQLLLEQKRIDQEKNKQVVLSAEQDHSFEFDEKPAAGQGLEQ